MFWLGLIIGLLIGGVAGMFTAAMCAAAGRDRDSEI